MDQLVTTDVQMTSLDIAELTGKQHAHVMRDIRSGLKNGYLKKCDFNQSHYFNTQNKKLPCFIVSENGFNKILNRYKMTKKRISSNVIYIVKHIGMDSYYKIGITSNLNDRLKAFNCASPLGIELICRFETSEAAKIEAELHNLLSEKNTNLEWFELSREDLLDVVNLIKRGVINELAG